jgi:hypothetical protein
VHWHHVKAHTKNSDIDSVGNRLADWQAANGIGQLRLEKWSCILAVAFFAAVSAAADGAASTSGGKASGECCSSKQKNSDKLDGGTTFWLHPSLTTASVYVC